MGDILTITTVREREAFRVRPELLPTASLNISFFGGADVCYNLVQGLRKKCLLPLKASKLVIP